jgi:hypothetical protein
LKETNGPRENIYIRRSLNEQKLTSIMLKLGKDFVSNYKVPGSRLVADFYHAPSKTIIEVNGPSHYLKKFDGKNIIVSE